MVGLVAHEPSDGAGGSRSQRTGIEGQLLVSTHFLSELYHLPRPGWTTDFDHGPESTGDRLVFSDSAVADLTLKVALMSKEGKPGSEAASEICLCSWGQGSRRLWVIRVPRGQVASDGLYGAGHMFLEGWSSGASACIVGVGLLADQTRPLSSLSQIFISCAGDTEAGRAGSCEASF